MRLNARSLADRAPWEAAGVSLPGFPVEEVWERTRREPAWLHFGAGNIFRAFLCAALQRLLDGGEYNRGVIVCETHDPQLIPLAYAPFDNLSLLATLRADGGLDKRALAAVAEALGPDEAGLARMAEVFCKPTLQMVTFTVTEKAYRADNPLMGLLAGLLARRHAACGMPLSLVSLDNCAHNGRMLRDALLAAARSRVEAGELPAGFLTYAAECVAFPNTMIDKITPHPSAKVADALSEAGFEDCGIIRTEKGTVTAAFVNAEEAEYLVIEDAFPNGRPPLEKAGILFTGKETVDKAEKMKVGACLNPLHTALAVLGSLLGYEKISDEMRDPDLRGFVERLGYRESLPVAEDPGVISPRAFLDEVLQKRVSNPFLPDTPQRIATDTSQKLPVRFGWTIAATKDKGALVCVPFVFAAWLRYITGVDDQGRAFEPSPDPRLAEVRSRMAEGLTDALLSDATLVGADLVEAGLAAKVRQFFGEMMEGGGAVRRTLRRAVESQA